jgi:acetyl-CoA acetyltransferase
VAIRRSAGDPAQRAEAAQPEHRRDHHQHGQQQRQRQIRYGLQTMCEGGGQANATILELL